ncbi:TRAP transporter large permease [Halomonas sp. HAL1]|uniref:TRAP transporter large permease n=1 Tax=Halomonas sp. HAL1 TaxID=550984 RepID=UPI00022D338A|nr:TRAP transporter large permease [Halomonas sp. HAL1]EHA16365.1 putative TRAP C4-dicarboxylate transport system permease DctM subunit [Halomonas sp. HAL1]WKV94200.1 TRAP transporter large permease [Halomonas sp. HAL1]
MLTLIAILFVLLLLLGMPVGLILLSLSVSYVLIEPAVMDVVLAQRIVQGTQSFPLLAVPLFILVGELMNISGISRRVMDFASALTRRIWGGVAQTNILLSTLLAGMSGSANGDAAMQAKILVPEMTKRGYPLGFSSAITAMSSLIAPMIPPGIGLILFGFVTNTSIGSLFAGAILPGLFLALVMMAQAYFIARKNKWDPPSRPKAEGPALLNSFYGALPAIMLPVMIIVSIRGGIFTPAEAAGIAVIYTVLCMMFYREASWTQVWQALRSTIATTAAIMLVLAASAAFSWVLTFERVPQTVAEGLLTLTDSPTLLLMLIAGVLLIAGAFIEGTALILILGPIFLPVTNALGIDPVQYGVVFVLMAHLGGVTPPVGTIMFTTCTITKTPLTEFIRAVWPMIVIYLIFALLLIGAPVLSTGLAHS